MANNEENVKKNMFGLGEANDAYAKYFVGKSYLNNLAASDLAKASVANVSFEPGCRNNWHEHENVQILVAVAGEGWYQEEGKDPQKLTPGDVVIVNPHTKHWHGASKDSWFAHLAIMVGEGKTSWYEPVSDEEYNKL